MALISILMPTYNVALFVREAVESILNQTLGDFELIIVDDGSTDGTYNIIKELAQRDKRIKLYKSDVNQKICKTLNMAWSHAKGDFIGRMDGDDISQSNRFSELKKYLDEHPDCALVGSGMITIDEKGEEVSRPRFITKSENIYKYMKYRSCIPHIWLARREVYERLNGYREIPYAEDYDFLMRAMQYGFGLANVNQYLYKCRIRNGNTGSTNGLAQHKAKLFVNKLYIEEKREGKEIFSNEAYKEAISSTERDLEQFKKAREHLTFAVFNKKNKLIMIKNTIQAMMLSTYIFRYILEALIFRWGIHEENKIAEKM